ncbi:hypothetical protein [Paenibacillus sp.]|uniref:hypothetical protein n=1 Tax=Paenibacillus sp. TaxID=58172 RepID=UPI002D251885|nr:hypothetical protein [Paenibacillus sp.]HZG58163.1 hypothetical protein [Paenibacillus sp.]
MIEERLERMEQHIVQLIQMVALNNQKVTGLEQRLEAESDLHRQRHDEVLRQYRHINTDMEFLHQKVGKHELEIEKLKSKL